MKAILRRIRISPKKANLVAALVRNKKAVEAVDILKFTPKKAARPLKKLIESALANAENNLKQSKDDLYIKEIIVTQGPTYKRGVPISKGRTHPILKRTSHITVQLQAVATSKQEEKKVDEKPAVESKTSTPKTVKENKPTKK